MDRAFFPVFPNEVCSRFGVGTAPSRFDHRRPAPIGVGDQSIVDVLDRPLRDPTPPRQFHFRWRYSYLPLIARTATVGSIAFPQPGSIGLRSA